MKQNSNAIPAFKGTVSELAGRMVMNGEVLTLQDVQFLTRIGDGSFAKRVGFAPGTGTRGGKRATIWEINPSARISFGQAEPATGRGRAKSTKSENANVDVQPGNKAFDRAVAAAVEKVLASQKAPAKRRGRSAKASTGTASKSGNAAE